MKYLVISDIHGDIYYAKKIEEIIGRENPDKIILLGDLYYNNNFRNIDSENNNSKEVAKILNKYKDIILCTKGNCDRKVDEDISEFNIEEYIVLKINNKDVFCSHGHIYNSDNVPPIGDIVLYGHFHTGFIKEEYGIVFASPGTIAFPRSGSRNSYLIIDNGTLILKDVEGNIIDEFLQIRLNNLYRKIKKV